MRFFTPAKKCGQSVFKRGFCKNKKIVFFFFKQTPQLVKARQRHAAEDGRIVFKKPRLWGYYAYFRPREIAL